MNAKIGTNMLHFASTMEKKFKRKTQRITRLENIKHNYVSKTKKVEQSSINIDLEHKAKRLFSKLNLRFDKIPTLSHDEGLAEDVEGTYAQEKLSVRKNPRVSDRQSEAVVMHEMYHHAQKDKGLALEKEESEATMVEDAYLDENQVSSTAPDFDLIYAHTIKTFYEQDELEKLVQTFGGDRRSARVLYSTAMQIINEVS